MGLSSGSGDTPSITCSTCTCIWSWFLGDVWVCAYQGFAWKVYTRVGLAKTVFMHGMTECMAISLLRIQYIHRAYMYMHSFSQPNSRGKAFSQAIWLPLLPHSACCTIKRTFTCQLTSTTSWAKSKSQRCPKRKKKKMEKNSKKLRRQRKPLPTFNKENEPLWHRVL